MDLQIFRNNGWEIRTIEKDGEPWFVARDIAKTLGYSRPSDAIRSHCRKANDYRPPQNGAPINPIPMKIIPESDVYRLIMRSQLDSAERFQDWVVEEVLPEIRKTGSYEFKVPTTLGDALQLAADQAKQLEEQRPKVEFHDAVQMSPGCIDMKGMAKLTKRVGRNKLFALMRNEGVLMSDNTPYADFINRGHFEVIEKVSRHGSGCYAKYLMTTVTNSGQKFIIKNLDQWLRNYEEA